MSRTSAKTVFVLYVDVDMILAPAWRNSKWAFTRASAALMTGRLDHKGELDMFSPSRSSSVVP